MSLEDFEKYENAYKQYGKLDDKDFVTREDFKKQVWKLVIFGEYIKKIEPNGEEFIKFAEQKGYRVTQKNNPFGGEEIFVIYKNNDNENN